MIDIKLGDEVYYLTVDGVRKGMIEAVVQKYIKDEDGNKEEVINYSIENDKSIRKATSYSHERIRESIFKNKDELIEYIKGLE